MKNTNKLKTPKRPLRMGLVLALVSTVVFGIAIWVMFGWIVIAMVWPNPAQEVAKPLEASLVKAGALKKCSSGKNGRGLDTAMPQYESYLQLNMSKDRAVDLIKRTASENGFTLMYDSQDGSIEHYNDRVSKNSNYAELQKGKVGLSFSTYSNTSQQPLTCSDGPSLKGDKSHTAIRLSIGLPLVIPVDAFLRPMPSFTP